MRLSIVTTLYQSAPTLLEFYERIKSEAAEITGDHEIILVNDGSPDESLAMAIALHERDARVRVIDLSRNFGEHQAITAGLQHARGDLVYITDSDLEEPPELLTEFFAEFQDSSADVVYGVQKWRKGRWLERISGRVFFWVFNRLSKHQAPLNVVTTRIMSRRYVESLLSYRERETILGGLFVLTGYQQQALPIVKTAKGRSSYNLRRKLVHLVNSVTSFSDKPLVLMFWVGVTIMLLSAVWATALVAQKLFFGISLTGWPSLIVSIWFLGGLTIFQLGVIGIYLSKVLLETKRRPQTIVRQIYERDVGAANAMSELSTEELERHR